MTKGVVAGTYDVGPLKAGATRGLRVSMRTRRATPEGTTIRCRVAVRSTSERSRVDVVRAVYTTEVPGCLRERFVASVGGIAAECGP